MYRNAMRGELVPELGNVNGVPSRAPSGLGDVWSDLITTVTNVGSQYLTKDINEDIAKAQLELAKVNAQTAADQVKATQAAALLKAQTAAPTASGGVSMGTLGLGASVLIGGGLLAYMFMGRRRR